MDYDDYELVLYHHGVKGMKWGVRKKPDPAKQRYKAARKKWVGERLRYAFRDEGGFGIKGIAKDIKDEKRRNQADVDFASEKARYKGTKSKKGEFNTYVREMAKSGLVNSARDRSSGGRSKMLYDRIARDKGKAYADKVQKKLEKRQIAEIAVTAVAAIGLGVVQGILETRQ